MAGGPGFRDSLADLWNSIVQGQGSFKALRWLLALLLVIGTIWSGFMFKKVLDFTKPTTINLPPAKDVAAQDAQRLDAMIDDFRNSVLSRTGSSTLAVAAAESFRRPLVETEKPLPPEEIKRLEEEALAESETVKEFIEPEESLPPIMTVRAIMTVGSRRSAIMDIEGEGEALVVRPGFVFGEEDKGIIKAIRPDMVIVEWSGEIIDLPTGM